MTKLLVIFWILCPVWIFAQTTVVGRVISHSGEPVEGVHIRCVENQQGTTTDSTGYFRLECTIPCTLELTHIGYISENFRLVDDENPFVIVLRNKSTNIKEVFVTGVPTTGNILSSAGNIERIPAILGEQDILKYLATLPGIVTTNPFNSGIYVRGGNSNENGFMINEMSIANPDHLTGILSTFDPYILSHSTLYKSGFPARFNSYLSSYLNMRPDAGNKWEHEGELTIGLLSSALRAKGPLLKGNTSYALSVRTSYLQHIARLYNKNIQDDTESNFMPEYSFSDITLNIDSRLSEKWRLNTFGLFTIDRLRMKISEHVNYKFDWNTFSGNMQASYAPTSANLWTLQAGIKTAFSEGGASGSIPLGGGNRYYTILSRIAYSHVLSDRLRINSGGRYEYNRFETANREDGYGNLLIKSSDNNFQLYDLYFDIDFQLNNHFTMSGGMNYQFYAGETHAHTLSPRLKISYTKPGLSIWADYSKTTQYLSLYPYFTVKTPIDIWYPLGKENHPAICHQYSIGLNKEIRQRLQLYAGVFYKEMRHVKDFAYDINTEYAVLSENQIEGKGNARGFELDLSFSYRKLFTRANYTLSESKRKFTEINDGKSFFPPYDVKHNIVWNLSYEFSQKVQFNLLWTFSSGTYTTFPVGIVIAHNITDVTDRPVIIPVYKDRYNYKLPNNHRLDANLDYAFTFRSLSLKLSVGAYNIYNQSNPSFVYFRPQENDSNDTRFVPKSKVILPFIPYVSLRLKW